MGQVVAGEQGGHAAGEPCGKAVPHGAEEVGRTRRQGTLGRRAPAAGRGGEKGDQPRGRRDQGGREREHERADRRVRPRDQRGRGGDQARGSPTRGPERVKVRHGDEARRVQEGVAPQEPPRLRGKGDGPSCHDAARGGTAGQPQREVRQGREEQRARNEHQGTLGKQDARGGDDVAARSVQVGERIGEVAHSIAQDGDERSGQGDGGRGGTSARDPDRDGAARAAAPRVGGACQLGHAREARRGERHRPQEELERAVVGRGGCKAQRLRRSIDDGREGELVGRQVDDGGHLPGCLDHAGLVELREGAVEGGLGGEIGAVVGGLAPVREPLVVGRHGAEELPGVLGLAGVTEQGGVLREQVALALEHRISAGVPDLRVEEGERGALTLVGAREGLVLAGRQGRRERVRAQGCTAECGTHVEKGRRENEQHDERAREHRERRPSCPPCHVILPI